MSILAINIGNTNVHFGFVLDHEVRRLTIKANEIEDSAKWVPFLRQFEGMSFSEVRIASVNPQYVDEVCRGIQSMFEIPIFEFTHNSLFQNDYHRYQEGRLGIDRILVCEAAAHRGKFPAIIFDFGTATTMNVIDEKGIFIGGAIFPGIWMGNEALTQKTALLPSVDLRYETPDLLGLSTKESMASAALFGNAAMVEGMVSQVEKRLSEKPTIYLTGGAAYLLKNYLPNTFEHAPNLLLEGMLMAK